MLLALQNVSFTVMILVELKFNVPFQHNYGYIRDERSQFIEATVKPSVFLPGIISLVIMCIGIIWNNSFLVGWRARAEARIDPGPLRTSRSTAHGAQVVWPLDYMGRADDFGDIHTS